MEAHLHPTGNASSEEKLRRGYFGKYNILDFNSFPVSAVHQAAEKLGFAVAKPVKIWQGNVCASNTFSLPFLWSDFNSADLPN